ncbi:MAG TPA: Hsp20/alpha crystallin family protein [Gaiellaceae bacterium]|nr:Hsp20/alpha crystallin family protein [Gaiellaceae bacterium]
MTRRRDPARLSSDMEELFADLWHHRLVPQRLGFRPRVDVYRTEEPAAVHVVVELPGIDPDGIDVAVADGVLSISGTRTRESESTRRYEHIEIDYGPFERRLAVGDGLNAGAAEAHYERGLLTIVLPVAARKSGPTRIAVTRGEQ